MIRSRFGRAVSTVPCSSFALPVFAERALEAARSASRAIAGLATIPPCDHYSERDVEPAKAERQEHISPFGWRKQRKCAYEHETQPHNGHNPNGKSATCHDSGPIQEQPQTGSHAKNLEVVQNSRENGAGQKRRHKTQQSAPRGS